MWSRCQLHSMLRRWPFCVLGPHTALHLMSLLQNMFPVHVSAPVCESASAPPPSWTYVSLYGASGICSVGWGLSHDPCLCSRLDLVFCILILKCISPVFLCSLVFSVPVCLPALFVTIVAIISYHSDSLTPPPCYLVYLNPCVCHGSCSSLVLSVYWLLCLVLPSSWFLLFWFLLILLKLTCIWILSPPSLNSTKRNS